MDTSIFLFNCIDAASRRLQNNKKRSTLMCRPSIILSCLVLFINHKLMNSCLIVDSCANEVNTIRKS